MRHVLPLCLLLVLGCGADDSASKKPSHAWPPEVGKPYPDLALVDQTGQRVSLSSFKGRILLIEPIGMNCAACQAFAGGNRTEIGPYEGVSPQADLQSIEEYLPKYADGVKLDDKRIVYVQLLLYSMSMAAPTAEDAKAWAEHFKMDRSKDRLVLAGETYLIVDASYNMIPGFQLVNEEFVLVSDSSGHNPKDNLYTKLLPELGKLLAKK